MLKVFVPIIFLVLGFSVYGQTGTVIFEVYDIEKGKGGELSAGIFMEENFPEVGKAYRSSEKKVNSVYMEVYIKDIPAGTYGAVVFQDIDQDKKLKTNLAGFPTEPIGFANDARIRFGPPSFDDASVLVKPGGITRVKIRLR